jgi:uncharacterized phage protein gp47/JayE
MPFARPTLTTLRGQAQQDVLSDPAVGSALLRFANTRVLAKLNADFAHMNYGFLDYIAKQAVPFTTTDEFLEAWAGLKGITRKAASAAVLSATFTGTNGVVLPVASLVIAADGTEFTTQADQTVSGGSVTVSIAATSSYLGTVGNLDVGTAVALGSAIPGIQSNGTVAAEVTAGADTETDDDLRTRMLEAYANPPQGGDAQDYVTWALQVAGVTRAWPMPNALGAGTVSVYFMMDEAESIHGGFPQGTNGVATSETRGSPTAVGDQLLVANYIYPLRPVTAVVYAIAPTASPVAFTIKGVASGLQAAVGAAIDDVFLQEGTPGGVTLPDGTTGGTVDLKEIWAAIDAVAGIGDYDVVSPTADIVMATGNLPTRGVITWT